jgi:hypothetical protein
MVFAFLLLMTLSVSRGRTQTPRDTPAAPPGGRPIATHANSVRNTRPRGGRNAMKKAEN